MRAARLIWCLRMDPQITEIYGEPDWIVRQHRAAFDEFGALGDDVGLHTHPYRWDAVEEGWVIRQMELTEDFDALYAKMMALGTTGGAR